MGNGASIFLSADLSKNLSEKSIRTFQEFENECIARNLNAEQIYELLVNKYEELLDFDSHKRVEPKPVDRPDTVSTKAVPQKAKRPPSRVSWGSANVQTKKKLEKRSEIIAHYSKLSQKAKSAKLPDADSSRSLSTFRGSMDGTELKAINKDAFCLTRVNSLETLGDDDQTFCLTGADTITCELSSTTTDVNDGGALIPSEEFECKLCRKSFNSKSRLDRHLRFSEIHRQTLISLKERFFDDANGLDSLAKKAIEHFQESFKASYSYLDGDLNLNRLRWKKAIGKVVSRFIARKYETFVSQLHHSQLHPPLIDDKIILLHTDHKFFWRSKSRFLFHFYFHEMYDCIEVIPQLLPSMSLQSNPSTDINNSNSNEISTTFKVDSTKISPRFYINRRVIHKILLQQKEYSMNCEDENDVSMESVTTTNNSDPSASITSQPSLTYINPEAITIPPPTITDLEICKFLLSKLKIDNQLLESQVMIEKAIYFDSNHMMKNEQQPMAINTVIPYGLKAVNIEGLKLYDSWEIQMKLQEIQSSHEELNHAVNKADHFSRSIKLFSPSNIIQRLSPYLSPKKRFNPNKFNLVVTPTGAVKAK